MPSTKKKYVDIPESLLLEIDNLKSEVQVLRRTVDSKSRAVVILRKQLASVKEQAGIHDCLDKQTQTDFKNRANESGVGSPEREHHLSSNNVLAELLSISKRENKALKQDILSLRCKLHDALADLKVVRSETPLLVAGGRGGVGVAAVQGPLQQQWQRQERLHLISQLELLTDKVSTLTSDVRCLSADRDELLQEREHSRVTVARLSAALRAASAQPPDASPSTGCLAAAGRQAPGGSGEEGASPLQSIGEKLRRAEQEIVRLEAVVADYELLASLQRASQQAPHLSHGVPRQGSGDDVKQAVATETPISSPPESVPAVVEPGLPLPSSDMGDEKTGCVKISKQQRKEQVSTRTDPLPAEARTQQPEGVTLSGTVPGSDDPSLSPASCDQATPALEDGTESPEVHSCSSQPASRVSLTVQNSSATTLDCHDSIEELSDSDRKLQATQKWLSRLEVSDGVNRNGYFGSDFPEEIVSIEEIGAPRISTATLQTEKKSRISPPSPSMDISSTGECSLVTENKLHPSENASSTSALAMTDSAPGVGEGCSDYEGFSDYDSDDGNFEAELNQWQKSAGALLSKAQKKTDKM